jgi:hypothetical protein
LSRLEPTFKNLAKQPEAVLAVPAGEHTILEHRG